MKLLVEHEEHGKISKYTFADNLSDVPSESEDVDLSKDYIESERSEEDDSNSNESSVSGSDVVIPSKRWKTVISKEEEEESWKHSKMSKFTKYLVSSSTKRFNSTTNAILKGPEATVLTTKRRQLFCHKILIDTKQIIGAIAQYQATPLLLEVNPTPLHESRDPNRRIANFRCISVAPEEARFSGTRTISEYSIIIHHMDEPALFFKIDTHLIFIDSLTRSFSARDAMKINLPQLFDRFK
ncbi:hypothetical protein WN51_06481 [Melipona quadrifasciata]|uniref:Uncharacterized protein n=1 Tax=Melipona quadrifasciata TaxID=166423 RepID=A0A0M9AAW1_9HYME|nr:hypothetical protein WN51_06481 [Melipona quadrifasciata]